MCQDLRVWAAAGAARGGSFCPYEWVDTPRSRRRLLGSHEAMRRRLGEAAAPSRLRLVIFLEIEAQVIAAVQHAPQAPGRDAEPASRLAAIAAAQLHRRLRGSGGDRGPRRGGWNPSGP